MNRDMLYGSNPAAEAVIKGSSQYPGIHGVARFYNNRGGDLPPLLANRGGYAMMIFYTDRFRPREILGRTLVIHDMPDDFRTQPSGNSGMKIACGLIFPKHPE